MKPRSAWLLQVSVGMTGFQKPLATILPSRKVTNQAVYDIVRDLHLKAHGRFWPNDAAWVDNEVGGLKLVTPICTYHLSRIEVYG